MFLSTYQPMPLSHPMKRRRTGSYLPQRSKGMASVATESEAVRLLAAHIPPELFENILFYVNVDRVSQRHKALRECGRDLIRNRGEPSTDDILADLKRCSLVCLFWADRCRRHMFSERTLWINSYQDAEIFRRYVIGGCQSLTPVHQLITNIYIAQDYSGMWASQGSERQTSFLHLLYLPTIQDKLEWFSIEGPVPDGFNHAKLDTPHWGIPPSILASSSFLQNMIFVRDVHLPSFYHVAKYIRHFTCATYIEFEKISWDGHTPTYSLPWPQASNRITCQRRPRFLMIRAYGVCTNAVHLALTALMLNRNCPLRRLSDEQRVWTIKFMTLLWGHRKDSDVRIEFDVSEQATTMHLKPFHFVFEETPAPTDRSASVLSIVGMHAYIDDFMLRTFPANFDALFNHARAHPTIRALVLLFDSFGVLQKSMEPFVQVLALAAETIDLVLAYEKKGERKAVGVDLATLEPSGHIWTDLPESEWYKGHLRSLHILEWQLEKKPRLGRLH